MDQEFANEPPALSFAPGFTNADADVTRLAFTRAESVCGYTFKNKLLLERSLEPVLVLDKALQLGTNGIGVDVDTQPDSKLVAREQLAFLGRGLVQLMLTKYYWKEYPKDDAVSLENKRSTMMSNNKLAQIAQQLGLGVQDTQPMPPPPEAVPVTMGFTFMSGAAVEPTSPVRAREQAIYALIGGVYSDAGPGAGGSPLKGQKAAKKVVCKLWGLGKRDEESSSDEEDDGDGGDDKGDKDDDGSDGGCDCDCSCDCGDCCDDFNLIECCFCCCDSD